MIEYMQDLLFITQPQQQAYTTVQKWNEKPFLQCDGLSQRPSWHSSKHHTGC
jgi:hypothetical protein